MMVPVQEFQQLEDYYKGKMTESALLNKAGHLATEEQLILKDKRIPASIAVKMTKPLGSKQGRLVKRIRTGTPGPMTYQGTTEPEGMVDSPAENLLKKIIKGVNKDNAAPIIIKQEAATPISRIKKKQPWTSGVKKTPISRIKKKQQPYTSGVKKTPKGPKPPIPPKPSSKSESRGFKKTVLSGATKGGLKSLGLSYTDNEDKGGYSPKGKGKKKHPKAKKTALQKLQEGWEDWDTPYH